MWDRKDLKAKGKAAYRANRVTCIIAALILSFVLGTGGTGAYIGSEASSFTGTQNAYDDEYIEIYDDGDIYEEWDGEESAEPEEIWDAEESGDLDEDGFEVIYDDDMDGFYVEEEPLFSPVLFILLSILLLIVFAIAIAMEVFLLNPAEVGLRKFFIDNAYDHNAGLNKRNLGLAFSNHYKKVVLSMFTTGLFTFLWSLLFIIPGIYKSYQWRLVPYIISEDPEISGDDARKRSAEMMNGSKWRTFVLDLSFLGWILLGVLTLGILNLIFTNPYRAATDAELYLALSGRADRIPAAVAEGLNRDPEGIVTFDIEEEYKAAEDEVHE